MFTLNVFNWVADLFDACPYGAASGRVVAHQPERPRALYTAEERRRRDQSPWTLVQGVLAPIQFAVFLISLGLVLRFLATGEGQTIATVSIVV